MSGERQEAEVAATRKRGGARKRATVQRKQPARRRSRKTVKDTGAVKQALKLVDKLRKQVKRAVRG